MQTHIQTIYTYTIDEHPDKDACFNWIRENWHDLYGWQDENADSLKAFCDHFDVSLKDWEVSLCGHSYAYIDATEWNTENSGTELSGVRLWKYLQNNGYLTIANKWHPKYSERGPVVSLLDGNCPFTGMCYDEVLLDPIREFMAHPVAGVTMQDLVNDAAAAWVKSYIADWEYAYSDEGLLDMCQANEYQFTESGAFYT